MAGYLIKRESPAIRDAAETAEAHLNNAGLPSYNRALLALERIAAKTKPGQAVTQGDIEEIHALAREASA